MTTKYLPRLKRTGHGDVFVGMDAHETGDWVRASDLDELLAEVTHLRAARGCPCLYTTPCQTRCSCLMPLSSHGCRRCCRHGSPEQQRAMAERLAALDDADVELTRRAAEIAEALE